MRVGPPREGTPLSTFADGEPWAPLEWTRLADGEGTTTVVTGSLVEAMPTGPDSALLHQSGEDRYVRLHITTLTESGEATIRFPEGAGGTVALSLLGYRVAPLAEDFVELPADGGAGLAVLLRSVGLLDEPEMRRAHPIEPGPVLSMLPAVRAAFGLPDRLGEEPVSGVVGPRSILGLAAAFWILPEKAPDAFVELVLDRLADDSADEFGRSLLAAIENARLSDPYAWAIATQTLLPSSPKGAFDARCLAEAVFDLPAEARAALVSGLDRKFGTAIGRSEVSRVGPSLAPAAGLVREFIDLAGPALMASVTELSSDDAVRDLLGGLARLRAGSALSGVFGWRGEAATARILEAMDEPQFTRLAQRMAEGGPPDDLLDALGSGSVRRRNLAAAVLTGGSEVVLAHVAQRLVILGYQLDDTPKASDPTALPRAVQRLQGVLLAPLARPYHDEAGKLHERSAPCVEPFERARKEIHPDVVLAEPLYSQCRTLAAVALMESGDEAGSRALMTDILRTAPPDPIIRARHAMVVAGHAKHLLDSGDLEAAEAAIDALDRRSIEALVPIRAEIESQYGDLALARGDEDAARRRFETAYRLDPSRPTAEARMAAAQTGIHDVLWAVLVMALCAGVAAGGWRRFQRAMTVMNFRLDGPGKDTMAFDGPGFRRVIVSPIGILSLRPLAARIVAWAEIEGVYLLSGTSARSGLLVRLASGSAFVVPTRSLGRFDLFVSGIEPFLRELAKPMITTRPVDEELASENDDLVDSLRGRERWNGAIRISGLVVAGILAYAVIVAEAAGGVWYLRLPIALGIATGVSLASAAVAHVLAPMGRT